MLEALMQHVQQQHAALVAETAGFEGVEEHQSRFLELVETFAFHSGKYLAAINSGLAASELVGHLEVIAEEIGKVYALLYTARGQVPPPLHIGD